MRMFLELVLFFRPLTRFFLSDFCLVVRLDLDTWQLDKNYLGHSMAKIYLTSLLIALVSVLFVALVDFNILLVPD